MVIVHQVWPDIPNDVLMEFSHCTGTINVNNLVLENKIKSIKIDKLAMSPPIMCRQQ